MPGRKLVADIFIRPRADEDADLRACLGHRAFLVDALQSRRGVDRVADDGVFAILAGADVSPDRLSGEDADT